MEPIFLLPGALGEDIIHQALSWAKRFLFTEPTVFFHTLPRLSLTRCSSLCPLPSLPVILHIIRAWGRWKKRTRDGYCACVCTVCVCRVLRETMWWKRKGEESREKKETPGYKKLPKLPQGRHILCGKQQSGSSVFFLVRRKPHLVSVCFYWYWFISFNSDVQLCIRGIKLGLSLKKRTRLLGQISLSVYNVAKFVLPTMYMKLLMMMNEMPLPIERLIHPALVNI